VSASWKVYESSQSAAEACATHIVSVLDTPLRGGTDVAIAVSGGSTPKLMFDCLARSEFDWNKVHLFQVDERGVPPDHPDSNYLMTEEHLIRPGRLPQRNVHRVHAELGPDVAARQYASEIREFFSLEPGELPHFDLVHLGVGPDGHTASLFPGEPMIDDRDGFTAAVWVEKMQQWRITLLPGVLLAARNTAVLAAGADKADALDKVLQGPYLPKEYPSQIIARNSRRASWFLDKAAAAKLAGNG